MDRAANGLESDGAFGLPPGFDAASQAPLDRPTAVAAITAADEHMDRSEPELAMPLYARSTWINDRDVAAAGFYGLGNALYRLDRETEARAAWERATGYGDTPVAYRAWRQVAAARVREGDLPGAIDAYHQCERRAPREDRAEIASRLGWLSKETGNAGAANRYFARSRGTSLPMFMTYLIIAVTVVTSLAAMNGALSSHGFIVPDSLEGQLALHPFFVAHGEYYRMLSVMLVHDPSDLLHLLFNMYALWFAGQLIERMYGSVSTLLLYLVCGAAASALSFTLSSGGWSVGASGGIFGMFGVILVATRYHHPILDAQSRSIAGQIGILIVLNLVLGFSGIFNVDNFAHVGGLVAGLWLGFILPPTQVQTLASGWQGRRGTTSPTQILALRVAGVAVLLAAIGGVTAYGTAQWQQDPGYRQYWSGTGSTAAPHVIAAVPAPTIELVIAQTRR